MNLSTGVVLHENPVKITLKFDYIFQRANTNNVSDSKC